MAIFALLLITACGQSGSEGSGESGESGGNAESSSAAAFDPGTIKTMGDVFAYGNEENSQEAFTDVEYIYVLNIDGVYYRAIAEMPEDVSKAVWAIDFDDEDRTRKERELVAPLELKTFENLTEQIPSQEELDQYVGKTGQMIFDEGWTYSYYNLEDMEAGMDHGPFTYKVIFNYDGEPMVNSDDFDFYGEFKDLTIKSITFDSIGDATNIE